MKLIKTLTFYAKFGIFRDTCFLKIKEIIELFTEFLRLQRFGKLFNN